MHISAITYFGISSTLRLIATYGYVILTLNLGLRLNFTWRFIAVDAANAINGMEFLVYYNFLVDIRGERLVDTDATLKVKCALSAMTSGTTIFLLTFPKSSDSQEFRPKSNTIQSITFGLHLNRRLHADRIDLLWKSSNWPKEFEQLQKIGFARHLESAWSSPLHIVPKKNEKCGDHGEIIEVYMKKRYFQRWT